MARARARTSVCTKWWYQHLSKVNIRAKTKLHAHVSCASCLAPVRFPNPLLVCVLLCPFAHLPCQHGLGHLASTPCPCKDTWQWPVGHLLHCQHSAGSQSKHPGTQRKRMDWKGLTSSYCCEWKQGMCALCMWRGPSFSYWCVLPNLSKGKQDQCL